MKKLSKPLILLSAFIALTLAVPGGLFLFSSAGSHPGVASGTAASDGDLSTASDISNMTGVSTERILQMRSAGKSWNEILEDLKAADTSKTSKSDRSQSLLEEGLGEDAVQRLVSAGYTKQDIQNAKMLAERVTMQIRELTDTGGLPAVDLPSASPDNQGTSDREKFRTELTGVAGKFDLETAVRFMLELKIAFGSMEAVLDEYLYALQFDLDLGQYSKDKDQYIQDKENKKTEHPDATVISMAEIEKRLLEQIQSENKKEQGAAGSKTVDPARPDSSAPAVNPLPEPPSATPEDVKPVNPAKAVEAEMQKLNPNVSIPK
ncbi:hypothetical protein [Gorillibacterium massiliense]|uniref:hypothetical protein n=1 Tax=Gorillibacterium massiliense TaxID=1280390 RepID=UPI0004BCB5FE|nr:hypothetical protein [Gorillibacterium massiliense]